MALLEDRHGVMWLGESRALYAGQLGQPGRRVIGCHVLYASLDEAFHFSVASGPEKRCDMALAPPYQPHSIRLDSPESAALCAYLIEPDSIASDALAANLPAEDDRPGRQRLLRRMRRAAEHLGSQAAATGTDEAALDRLVFGSRLPTRDLDPRIAAVLQTMRSNPTARLGGEACARSVHLSFSRFLHLFRQELGVPFRQFRAWRRARQFLGQVANDGTLTSVAIDLGYPDATHFSHSMRQVYGLKPKDILAAMRGAEIIVAQSAERGR